MKKRIEEIDMIKGLGILFQLQSFHLFDPSATGVHSMFYSVLIGWFIFQMAVSEHFFTY